MCLACGNFADVSGYNAFASFALALSPFFGLALLRFFRFTSIARLAQLPGFAERIGIILACYNSLILTLSALVIYGFSTVDWLRWPVMTLTWLSLVWLWHRLGTKLKRSRPAIGLVHTYLIAALGSLPFFVALALFAWQIQDHLQWAYLPYYYKPTFVAMLYQFGIFFQLLLACTQTVVLLWILQVRLARPLPTN